MSNTQEQPKKYNLMKDKKMLGMIILIVAILLQIFAWLKVPVLSSIHGYTIGMLFGLYNPLFYSFVIYMSIKMIAPNLIKKPSWLKISPLKYWFIAISIIYVGTSLGFYQSKLGYTKFGGTAWKSFSSWFDEFTSSSSAWAPKNTNGGLIGAFLYSMTSMMFTGIGSIIIAITALLLSISLIITGTSIGLYKEVIKKKNITHKRTETKMKKESNIDQFKTKDDEKENKPIDDLFLD